MKIALGKVKGTEGKTAYQVAVDEGFVGTRADWLASLKGDKGDDGYTPIKGKDYYTEKEADEFAEKVTASLGGLQFAIDEADGGLNIIIKEKEI